MKYLQKKCDYCRKREWEAAVMAPAKTRDGQCTQMFSVFLREMKVALLGRMITSYLSRVQVKKLFSKGGLRSSNKAKLAQLSKELCKTINLLEA